MDNAKVQKYLNPITFEAEMFVNNLEILSKTYHSFDEILVKSLEKVMNVIEEFLDSSPKEILATKNTKLVACDDIKHIKRFYHCSRCKTDLGKSAEKVTLHLTNQCVPHGGGAAGGVGGSRQASESISVKVTGPEKEAKNQGQNKSRMEIRRQKQRQQQDKRMDMAVKLTKKTRSLLTTDFNQFFSDHVQIGEKLKCIPDYDVIESDLLNLIKPMFPNEFVKIYKFGSRLSGIGSRESDLDLFIDIGNIFNTFQNRADKNTLDKLKIVGAALTKHHKSWKGLIVVDKARVPILKIIHGRTGIECDINFSNSMGSINTQFLKYIFTLQPIARLLCIFMKKWLNRTSLNNDMSTYSIILMIIFYLQTLEVIPAVEKFQQNVNPQTALTVGPWLCSYTTPNLNDLNIALEETTQPNLLKFIRGFFIFYMNYNFETDVICPFLGNSYKKHEIEKLMPSRYTTYVKSNADYALQLDKPIVVQDPIQLNHNVTKGLSAFGLQVFKTYMAKSVEVINDTFLF